MLLREAAVSLSKWNENSKEVQRNVVIICGSNKRTLRYVPPLAKVMPHRVICGAFLLLAHEMLLLTMRWLDSLLPLQKTS